MLLPFSALVRLVQQRQIKAQRPIVRTSVKLLTTNCWLASAATKVPRIVSDDCCRNSLALIAKKTTISAAPNPYPLTVVPQVRNNGLKPNRAIENKGTLL